MYDYKFILPFPPSINGYWRTFRNRQIISRRGREYREKTITLMKSYGLDKERLSGNLSVKLKLYPPTLRKYDIDNFCKAAFDALSHCEFWNDDEQVSKLSIEKMEKIKGGAIEVYVRRM